MPAWRAFAPWAVPFHLPRLTRWSLAPDCKVGSVAFAVNCFYAALTIFSFSPRKCAVISYCGGVKIQAAFQLVAVLVGNTVGVLDHRRHIIGRNRPMCRLADIERLYVIPIRLRVMFGDVPDRLRFFRCHLLHLVLTRIGIIGQMADIGDVDNMGEFVALVAQHAAQRVGKDIGAHVADMGVVVDCWPAGIDTGFGWVVSVTFGSGMNGNERLDLPRQAVEEA